MKRKCFAPVCAGLLALSLFSGCANDSVNYKNGSYTGKSGKDDRGAYGEVKITIKDNKLTACQFVTYKSDGTLKDESYGKINGEIANQDYYNKAQLAVKAMQKYAEQLVAKQKLSSVDAVAGATISFDQFKEAVTEALAAAQA